MKTSKTLFFLLLIIFISAGLNAQTDSSKLLAQFLFPEFSKGTVKFKNGSVTSARMNFNTLSGMMVFEQNGRLFDLINAETVDTIYLRNKFFVFNNNIFLEFIPESAIPLFVQYKGDLLTPGKPVPYGGTSQSTTSNSVGSVFADSKTFNLVLPSDYSVTVKAIYQVTVNGQMEKFINERQFLKLFQNKEKELKKFIKDNDISVSKTEDLVRLLNYCNGL